MITVYHNSKFLDRMPFEWGERIHPKVEDLSRVATVHAYNLDDAYRLTNTIDAPWWENELVNCNVGAWSEIKRGYRSTSCGDILVDKDGRAWIVAALGFERVRDLDTGRCSRCYREEGMILGEDLCVWCEERNHFQGIRRNNRP